MREWKVTFWWLWQVPSCIPRYWWLVESYLIDGIGVVSWLFGEFFHVRWKILFSHGGEHTRWDWNEWGEKSLENSGKTQISFLGGGDLWWVGWGMWGEVCKVGYARWGLGGGDLWWVGWGMRGEIHARWDLREVGYDESPSEIFLSLIFKYYPMHSHWLTDFKFQILSYINTHCIWRK